jgi:hypothetical protein
LRLSSTMKGVASPLSAISVDLVSAASPSSATASSSSLWSAYRKSCSSLPPISSGIPISYSSKSRASLHFPKRMNYANAAFPNVHITAGVTYNLVGF